MKPVAEREIPYRIDIPLPGLLRVILVAAGLFVVIISTWELHRGVWPLNGFSPFFFFMIAGAYSVGIPIMLAGLTGWSASWTVEPGRISIEKRNPFGRRYLRFTKTDVPRFEISEKESMEGDNTWTVTMITASGERIPTYDVQSQKAAERVRDSIVAAFDI